MTGARSDPMGTDVRGTDPMAGDESEGPMTRTSLEVKSVFGSIADECAAFGAGSVHPSSDDMSCPGFKSEAPAGAISRVLSDGRCKLCSS